MQETVVTALIISAIANLVIAIAFVVLTVAAIRIFRRMGKDQ